MTRQANTWEESGGVGGYKRGEIMFTVMECVRRLGLGYEGLLQGRSTVASLEKLVGTKITCCTLIKVHLTPN